MTGLHAGATCQRCYNAAKTARLRAAYLLAPKRCAHCQAVLPYERRRFTHCSESCYLQRSEALAQAMMKPERSDIIRDRRRRHSARRRSLGAKKKNLEQRQRIWLRDGFACWLCGKYIDPNLRFPDMQSLTVDHVVPLKHGGSDSDDNLRPAHFYCNSRRNHRAAAFGALSFAARAG